MSAKPQGVFIAASSENAYETRHFCVPRCYENDLKAILVPYGMVVERVNKIAEEVGPRTLPINSYATYCRNSMFLQIHADIGNEPLTVLCVLKGSYRFFSDLAALLSKLRAGGDYPLVLLHADWLRICSECIVFVLKMHFVR